ncbi:MAG: DegV family protein [Lachnospiraceae bacterium]|nr:DegV family protein [Lachnospiraceae bacterium]
MSDYILSCCSPADLTEEVFKEYGIHYVPFHVHLGNDVYVDDMGKSLPPAELYRRMVAGEDAKTSQVTVQEFIDYFESFLKEGKDILHVTLSSGISGAWNSACVAQQELAEQYPDRRIYIVDSRGASSGYGLFMVALAEKKNAGMGIGELRTWAEDHKLNVHHWFYSTDLTFYIKGGRVSRTAGFFGKMLNICPFLNMEDEGHLIPREKCRGKKSAAKRIIQMMEEHAEGGLNYSGKCFICQSDFLEHAQMVAARIEELFPNLDGKVQIFPIGATIGSHTGPGTLALFFFGDKRGK